MKRILGSLLPTLVIAAALMVGHGFAMQDPPTPPTQAPAAAAPQDQKVPEVSFTGCVIQGSAPTVFLLDNARMNAKDTKEKGRTFVIAEGTEDLNLRTLLNHEVTISGVAEVKAPPAPEPGQKVNEKDLPKLTAKSALSIADTCTSAAR